MQIQALTARLKTATLWKANMEPFASKAKLISPGVTNGGAPMGVSWLQEFISNCDGCHIEFGDIFEPVKNTEVSVLAVLHYIGTQRQTLGHLQAAILVNICSKLTKLFRLIRFG